MLSRFEAEEDPLDRPIVRLGDVLEEMPYALRVSEERLGAFLREQLGAYKKRGRLTDGTRPWLWAIQDCDAWAQRSPDMWRIGFERHGMPVPQSRTG